MGSSTRPVDITLRDRLAFILLLPLMTGWLLWSILTKRIRPPRTIRQVLGARVRATGEGVLEEIVEDRGHAFRAEVPRRYVDDACGESALELFEDGKPLGPAHSSHDDVAGLGGGRFSHWARKVWFSSSDDSDPRKNGRRYTFRVPRTPVARDRAVEPPRPDQGAPRAGGSAAPRAGGSGAAAGGSTGAVAGAGGSAAPPHERAAPRAFEERLAIGVLRCPRTGAALSVQGDALVSSDGASRWPIVRGIPRFVSSDQYVASFSFEWTTHDATQLDSVQRFGESEAMFRTKTGLTPDQVRGKLVLDAGVGAGRFADVLLSWGAIVVGADLSNAVESSFRNFADRREALICQADIGNLPFAEGTFDFIVSIGVLHHTPSTREFFLKLPKLLKPGGEIAIWVYPDSGDYVRRNPWIPLTGRLPPWLFHGFCKVLVHWIYRRWHHPLAVWINDVFPVSNQGLGLENDILDTYDGFSPRFHGTHGAAEVMGWFREAGLEDLREQPWPTAVRGRRPRVTA